MGEYNMVYSNKTKKFYNDEKEMKEAEDKCQQLNSEKEEAKKLINDKIAEANKKYEEADSLMDEVSDMIDAYVDTYSDYSDEWDEFFNTEYLEVSDDDFMKALDALFNSLFS